VSVFVLAENSNNSLGSAVMNSSENASVDDSNESSDSSTIDSNESDDDSVLGCKMMYWTDNTNRDCELKEFCGAYAYQSLQVFEDEDDCLTAAVALNSSSGSEEKTNELRERIREKLQARNEIKREIRANIREKLKDGEELTMGEKKLVLRRINNEILELKIKKAIIRTRLNLSGENETELTVHLSNGRNATIKIMPETASERALARLRLKNCNETRNCTIELKEVGEGNKTRAVYEARAEKKFKILWLFKNKEYVYTQIDSETGDVVKTHKPWWSLVASEEDESSGDNSSTENETDTNTSA
jgi:hypothetical protein